MTVNQIYPRIPQTDIDSPSCCSEIDPRENPRSPYCPVRNDLSLKWGHDLALQEGPPGVGVGAQNASWIV